jgi:hypothetical protein
MNSAEDLAAAAGTSVEWEQRVARLWDRFPEFEREEREDEFVAAVEALSAELPPEHAAGLFERGCAQDSTGRSDRAVPLYARALDVGLNGLRRRRAVIQMSSSLRNVGQAERAVELLTAERAAGSDDLDDAVVCTLALALADTGREREGLSLALTALSGHLVRYQRSMGNYARQLVDPAAG